MTSIIIKNGTIITLDKNRRILRNGFIAIEENKIIEVSKNNKLVSKNFSADIEIDVPRLA
jgi:cytosine/adenosine deaminase-related metal-dependent hydrolase